MQVLAFSFVIAVAGGGGVVDVGVVVGDVGVVVGVVGGVGCCWWWW